MTADRPAPADLAALFEAQVAVSPDATAAVAGATSLTYARLDDAANRLAHRLQGLGVGPDVVVGICVERGLELAIAVLGVLKAGGACLPLDPAYPAPRLAFMLEDASPPVVLTLGRLVGRLPAYGGHLVSLDDFAAPARFEAVERPHRETGLDHLAYVIYTSGSTGRPNGVMLVNRGLVNHAGAAAKIYELGPGDRVLQFCSISFDVSVEELFPTWASGATVVSRGEDTPILGRAWLDWLSSEGVTVVNLPTAYWHAWVRDLVTLGEKVPEGIRIVIVGGEKALGNAYRDWLAVGGGRPRWFNAYGPTEATVMATIYQAPPGGAPGDWGDPPVGRPLPGVEIHLLDPERRPVPRGRVGEVFIGGAGLARGYLARAALTAERFVADPFCGRPDARLYRTGDLGRLRSDGELEFVGRADDQVKVRGFRIECGEVEAALRAHPAIGEAVVVAREDTPGDRRLVAYLVAAGEGGDVPAGGDLRRFLAARLPGYMVPGAFVPLDVLPLTANGKVDRDALAPPTAGRVGGAGAPRTPTEEVVAAIWSDVLGVEGIGADDDFFDLGGHSLLVAQAVARIREELGAVVSLQEVFDAPTVAAVAALVDAAPIGEAGAGPPALVAQFRPTRAPASPFPLSLAQEQMWAVQTRAGTRVDNNVTACVRLRGPLDPATLRLALAALVDRHDSLRTSFPSGQPGPPVQVVAASLPVQLAVSDLSVIPPAERAAALHSRIAALDAEPFELARPPLFRFHLFTIGDGAGVAALSFDHLVCDGPSAYILMSELTEVYGALTRGEQPQLRPLAVSYADFAVWQRRWYNDERLGDQLEYWKEKLAGMPLGPAVPFDHLPATPTRRIVAHPVNVGPATLRSLQELARGCRASLFAVCVAAVSAVLSRRGGADDIVLSTTLSGRGRPELEGVVGNFAETGRLRTDLSGDPVFVDVVARARKSVLGLFEHQDIPFFRVREALVPDFAERGGGRPPLALLPVELQYFRAAHDHWAPGTSVVERPDQGDGPAGELFFRGQLHPLSVNLFDDGSQLWGQFSYKVDFYDPATIAALAGGLERVMAAVAADPSLPLSALPG